jgi:transcription elongation factor Elf1
MTNPLPCPICGGTEFSVEFMETLEGYTAFLVCKTCDEDVETQGPASKPCDTEEEAETDAIRVWNEFASRAAR